MQKKKKVPKTFPAQDNIYTSITIYEPGTQHIIGIQKKKN